MTSPRGSARFGRLIAALGCALLATACSGTGTDAVDPTATSAVARVGCPIDNSDLGGGDAIGDAPSGEGMAFSLDRDHSVVCLSNRGDSAWSIETRGQARSAADLQAAVIEATGIDNPLTPTTTGAKPKSARYVWGVATDAVSSVRVAVGGKTLTAKFYWLTEGLKPFLIQVPPKGRLVVTAIGAGESALAAAIPQPPVSSR